MEITEIGRIAMWVLAILIPAQLYIGYIVAKKSGSSAKSYFISGKELPLILIFMGDFATAMGVGNFIGYSGKGYEIGLGQFWMLFGEQGTKILFALLLAGFIGKFAYSTINQFMQEELFHDKWLRAAGGLLLSIPLVCTVGAQAIGIGTILHTCMGVDVLTGIWVASLTAILYTVMGGMWAIAWTDLLQGIIRIIVGFIFFAVVYVAIDGIGGLHISIAAAKPELWNMGAIGPLAAISLVLSPFAGQVTHQSWWQRCFAAKDAKTARDGFLLTAVFCIAMCSCSIMIGMAAYTLNPHLERPDMAFAWLLNNWMNPVLGALMVVTIIGADMTLSAGYLNSAVTMLVMDIVQPLVSPEASDKKLIRWARLLTLLLGVAAVAVALYFPSVMSAIVFGYAAGGGGLFMPLVLGLLWRKNGKTCVTTKAALASLILGGGTVVFSEFTPSIKAYFGGGIIPGICVSATVTIGISLIEHYFKSRPMISTNGKTPA